MEYVKQYMDVLLVKENLRNCKIVVNNSEKGDGYVGVIKFITLEGTTPEGNQRVLELVVKYAPNNEKIRKELEVRDAFLVEMYMYSVVHQAYRDLQEEYNIINPFTSTTKCFMTCDEKYREALVLQNIKASGFCLWDKKKPMSKSHVELVLKEYGKFHALSLALRERDEEKFRKMRKILKTNKLYTTFVGHSERMFKEQCDVVLKVFHGKEEEIYFNELARFKDRIHYFLSEEANQTDRYSIISHGDCWSNNMMFKYEDEKNLENPTSMIFLDWQCSKMSSAVIDLAYFFYCCGTKEMFDDLEKYLEIYHDSLSNILVQFGCDPEELYPSSKLEEHWKMYGKFGLVMALFIVRIMLSDKEESPDLARSAETGKSVVEAFIFESAHEDEFLSRLKDIVVHFVDRKLL